jgi:diguanylate cyclase (GGDEF)-like protein
MVFGWMDHLWSLVQIARDSCEILHFSDLKACQQMMIENEDIDFLFIEHEFVDDDTLKTLTALARSRGLSWVLVSETAAEEVELRALNHGAEQYMSLDSSSSLHKARIDKLVSDRRRFVSMERDARVDGMTQIANRREFQFRLEQEWQRVQDRQDGSISLLLIDLDHFKPYNDHYGHLAGDACLKRAASVFKSSVKRSSDLVARYGGEEFAVLVLDVSQKQALEIAERLRAALLEDAIEHRASPVNDFVTASIGVARIDYGASSSVGDLIKLADDGLYAAKGNGRNQVQVPPV